MLPLRTGQAHGEDSSMEALEGEYGTILVQVLMKELDGSLQKKAFCLPACFLARWPRWPYSPSHCSS